MNLRKLLPQCKCGGVATTANMYLTDKKSLMTVGICQECDQALKVEWPLRELYKECPKADTRQLLLAPPSDADFLQSMGITGDLPNC